MITSECVKAEWMKYGKTKDKCKYLKMGYWFLSFFFSEDKSLCYDCNLDPLYGMIAMKCVKNEWMKYGKKRQKSNDKYLKVFFCLIFLRK